MTRFLISRIASAILVLLGVSCIVFLMVHMVPGDPVEVMLGEYATGADREALRQQLGLDQPVLVQLYEFLINLASLDLGASLHSKRAITQLLGERLPATTQLALVSLLIACLIALPLGLLGAIRRGSWWDTCAMGFSVIGISIPNFVMGPLLILIFSVWFKLLPVSGNSGVGAIILPACTLGTAMAAILSRMIRASVLEVLEEEYIRTARSKGLSELVILMRHALANAALPVLTVLGLQLGTLLGGAVITEVVFSWPGIGSLTVEAIQRRDYPVLQGCVLIISIAYVVVNLLTDILYGWLDPRVRLTEEK